MIKMERIFIIKTKAEFDYPEINVEKIKQLLEEHYIPSIEIEVKEF